MEQALNMDALTELRDLMGDSLDEVLQTFIDYMPTQIDLLANAIRDDDAEQVFNVAHKMKSSCGSIGAHELAQLAEKIEMIGRSGTTENASTLLEEFKSLYVRVDAFLKSELNS